MQYSVPQFVDVEDKVIGPLSIKQFLWLLGGAGISVVLWLLLPTILAIILDLPVVLLAAGFAFFKVNGVGLQVYLANLVGFVLRPNTRVWLREVELDKTIAIAKPEKKKPKYTKVRLSDVNLDQLTYILDHELSAQAKARPITNPIENTPQPQPQVVLQQDIAVENTNLPIGGEQVFQEAPQMPQEAQQAPSPEPVSFTPLSLPKNPQIISSIKPFRTEK